MKSVLLTAACGFVMGLVANLMTHSPSDSRPNEPTPATVRAAPLPPPAVRLTAAADAEPIDADPCEEQRELLDELMRAEQAMTFPSGIDPVQEQVRLETALQTIDGLEIDLADCSTYPCAFTVRAESPPDDLRSQLRSTLDLNRLQIRTQGEETIYWGILEDPDYPPSREVRERRLLDATP